MNHYKIYFRLTILAVLVFAACRKGEIVKGAAYGKVNIDGGIISGDNVPPIWVQVNGETVDSMTSVRANITGRIIKAGNVQLVLRHSATGENLFDTSFVLKAGSTADIRRSFFYAGGQVYTDDFTVRPDQDSMLVRIINMAPLLPDRMDIEFGVYYSRVGVQMQLLPAKKISGITKTDMSRFIQLPNPALLVPAGATGVRYIIEGYNAVTREKVMTFNVAASQATMSYIITNPGATGNAALQWTNNLVLTIGIGPRGTSPNSAIHIPKVIFSHVAR